MSARWSRTRLRCKLAEVLARQRANAALTSTASGAIARARAAERDPNAMLN